MVIHVTQGDHRIVVGEGLPTPTVGQETGPSSDTGWLVEVELSATRDGVNMRAAQYGEEIASSTVGTTPVASKWRLKSEEGKAEFVIHAGFGEGGPAALRVVGALPDGTSFERILWGEGNLSRRIELP
jgi:hypothetical protein